MKRFLETYYSCLSGRGSVPASRSQALLFQTVFALIMAFVMILSVNLLLLAHNVSTSISMLATLPLWFAFAFALREAYANKASMLAKRVIDARLSGLAAQAVFIGVNVVLMAPVLCAGGVLSGIALGGLDIALFPKMYLHMLPRAAALAFVLAMLVVKPLTSLLFGAVLKRHAA